METSDAEPQRDRKRAWIVLAMVVLFMMINFGDKAVIGLAAVPIMTDLHLTHAQFGEVGSAFFLLFSVSAIAVGFVANRVPTKAVLTVMALIWALTQMPMLGMVSLSTLMASRIILGAAEGPAYPVALHAIYKWFPDNQRAFPTGFASIGGPLGIGLLSPLLMWIIVTYSWHAAFGFLGVVGFVWVAAWLTIGKEGPLDSHHIVTDAARADRVPYAALLTSRTFIGVTLAGFAAYWAVALAVVWVPSFLIKAGGFSPMAVGWILMLPPMLQLVLGPSLGLISQRLRARGVSSRVARGIFTGGSVALAGVAMVLLAQSAGAVEQILLVTVAFSVCGVTYALGPTLIGEISPVRQRGAMLGLSNGLFSTAGLMAPWLMGHIIDVGVTPAQGFRDGFLYAGWLIAIGGAIAVFLIDPARDLARFSRRAELGGR
jgi:MFS family permease